MRGKKILVVGGGGREHALAWRLSLSPQAAEVLVAPGNAGTSREAGERNIRNVDVPATDVKALGELAQREKVDLTVVGPEAPLAAGLVDHFQALGLRVFGPNRVAAQLESSKAFTKDFLARHKIPTAKYQVFTEVGPAVAYIQAEGAPIVIKADGLAAGKGVVVATTVEEAVTAARDMLSGAAHGKAGARVVVEEFLDGEEASFICMVDGKHVLALASSQDHKRVGDGDTGPNTGGMGAYSPAPVVTSDMHARVLQDVMQPTVSGMAAEGLPFTGFLYAGLMISPTGEIKVLEFNVRMGDPETQPILLRLKSDLVEVLEAAIDGRLGQIELDWDERTALGVVMAAANYPADPRKGDVITGLDGLDSETGKVFHAGTQLVDSKVVTSGGRVLCVCALGDSVKQAQANAYAMVEKIKWDGEHHRSDIGYRAIERDT